MNQAPSLITAEALKQFCRSLLTAAGLSPADVELVADSLVEANLRGIDSHGVARLPHYLRRLAQGSINPRPTMNFVKLGPAVGRLDGDHGLGQLVMHRAAQEAITLAKEAGTAWVSVCNSSHCGALDYYGLQIARAGMIGFVFTHVDPMVLPFGAKKPFCGTNPICITVPGESGQALCLDMATSKVPWNQVANAALEGATLAPGLAVDADGRDTTDPNAVTALFPFGLYKGSGLGLMVDVLCALLSGAPYGPDIPKMYGDLAQKRQLGGFVGAIDIRRFVPLEQFHRRVNELIQRWNALPPAEPGGQVLYPGQPEILAKEQRLRDGIPVPAHLVATFDQLSQKSHLARSLSAWSSNAEQS
jgi:ureidoglycolate dehydrogenase (NAD+)